MAPPPAKPRRNKRLQAYLLQNEERYKPEKQKRVIDLEQVKELCRIGCTMEEMSGILAVSQAWIADERDQNPAFALAMDMGYADMRQSLRRAQVAMALNGSAAMLIWLGKQHLGQSDRQVSENTTQINITVQRAMDELRNIPKDQLLAAQSLLGGRGRQPEIIENEVKSEVSEEGGPPV